MPQFTPPTSLGVSHVGAAPVRKHRYGCIAARINTDHNLRLSVDTARSRAGRIVVETVKDITRFPAEAAAAVWVCRSPHCVGKTWDSKAALLEAHLDQKILIQQEEAHLFMAVFERAAQPAQPAQMKGDKEVAPAQDARPGVAMLLSDEE